MRVLIVTFAFPPSNVIGAVRVGKLARYLDRSGHDVRVLTTDIVADRSLPLEIPREKVIYSDYRQRKPWAEYIARWLRRPPAAFEDSREGAPARSEASTTSLWSILRRHYLGLVHIPDMRSDWIKTALPAGKRLIKQWQPDIIFASAPPHTGLIVASRLARSFDIAWVADFRDLWVDNPYYNEPVWRKQIDTALERHTLRHVAGLVTVSPTWAEKLPQRHGKSVEVVYNGYAEEDFPPLEPRVPSGEVLTIRYMGSMYPGFRDPSPLFAAIGLLPDHLRNALKVEFFCDTGEVVLEAAAAHRVSDAVSAHRLVPYRRALELQTEADVLLLLQSSNETKAIFRPSSSNTSTCAVPFSSSGMSAGSRRNWSKRAVPDSFPAIPRKFAINCRDGLTTNALADSIGSIRRSVRVSAAMNNIKNWNSCSARSCVPNVGMTGGNGVGTHRRIAP